MADRVRQFDGLLSAVEERTFQRPPAIVCNAHITGLGVARALADHDVPVIAVDRTDTGVAPGSDAVDLAGLVTYPLEDPEGFRRDIERLADAVEHDPIAFPCMDEWVHAFADTTPAGVRRPFADRATIDAVLDKASLYGLADELDVPYPETYRLESTFSAAPASGAPPLRSAETAAERLGFPLVLKPALKREFEEAMGTNVMEVADRAQYRSVLEEARAADIRLMAQERVPVATGRDCSLASYVPPDGDPLAMVGNARVRYPRSFGTSCVVDRVDRPALRDRALSLLNATDYHGISESEFVYDTDRETYVLLDVNTRPWKWIGLPVAAGVDLPWAAYVETADVRADPVVRSDGGATRWVYLPDYLRLLAETPGFEDVLDRSEWLALLSGGFDRGEAGVTAGVYSPSDPAPAYRWLETEFGGREYYCAC